MFSISVSLSFSHSCSSLSYCVLLLLFFPILLPSEGCSLSQVLAVSPLCTHTLRMVGVLFGPGQKYGCRLVQATHRHLEATFGSRTLIIPEALGPHTIQGHSSDFLARRNIAVQSRPFPTTHLLTSDRCHSHLFSLISVSSPSW